MWSILKCLIPRKIKRKVNKRRDDSTIVVIPKGIELLLGQSQSRSPSRNEHESSKQKRKIEHESSKQKRKIRQSKSTESTTVRPVVVIRKADKRDSLSLSSNDTDDERILETSKKPPNVRYDEPGFPQIFDSSDLERINEIKARTYPPRPSTVTPRKVSPRKRRSKSPAKKKRVRSKIRKPSVTSRFTTTEPSISDSSTNSPTGTTTTVPPMTSTSSIKSPTAPYSQATKVMDPPIEMIPPTTDSKTMNIAVRRSNLRQSFRDGKMPVAGVSKCRVLYELLRDDLPLQQAPGNTNQPQLQAPGNTIQPKQQAPGNTNQPQQQPGNIILHCNRIGKLLADSNHSQMSKSVALNRLETTKHASKTILPKSRAKNSINTDSIPPTRAQRLRQDFIKNKMQRIDVNKGQEVQVLGAHGRIAFFTSESEIVTSLDTPNLVHSITIKHLRDCVPNILYDDFFFETHIFKDVLLQILDKLKYIPFVHGRIDQTRMSNMNNKFCNNYIILTNDVDATMLQFDFQPKSKVVLISTMSKYQMSVFLASSTARNILNLIVIEDPMLYGDTLKVQRSKYINLYTHELHIDGIGSSGLKILTSWRNNSYTRPDVNLFPPKLDKSLNGHRLKVSAFEQPPFVFRKKRTVSSDDLTAWDGFEIRLLRLIAEKINVTLSIQDTVTETENAGSDEVLLNIVKGKADIGLSGLYITKEFHEKVFFTVSHTQDCAAFITLSSTAIPKFRAILGPFQWKVWVCIIVLYLFGVVPIAYSYRLSWKTLFKNAAEVSHMFWMVFGTFTNLFTFKGDNSWNKSKKTSTRIMTGSYWVFTIIVTAAYSSSIISFITIPTYYDVVDSVHDLVQERFHVGVLDSREWVPWFNDTTDPDMHALFKKLEIENTTAKGLQKVQKREKYAFVGSKDYLSYIARTNFTQNVKRKKAVFHIGSDCMVQLMVSFAMKTKQDISFKISDEIQKMQENGLIVKIWNDIESDIARSSNTRLFSTTGKSLRSEVPEDRQLTLDDMQGMFLLLGLGLSMAGASLVRECWMGYQCCDNIRSMKGTSPIPSIVLTPCEDGYSNLKELIVNSALYRRAISAKHTVDECVVNVMHFHRRLSH